MYTNSGGLFDMCIKTRRHVRLHKTFRHNLNVRIERFNLQQGRGEEVMEQADQSQIDANEIQVASQGESSTTGASSSNNSPQSPNRHVGRFSSLFSVYGLGALIFMGLGVMSFIMSLNYIFSDELGWQAFLFLGGAGLCAPLGVVCLVFWWYKTRKREESYEIAATSVTVTVFDTSNTTIATM
jgi:hypothetical protein